MTTKNHLRDQVAQLEHDLADARRVHLALIDHANASEAARARFASLCVSAQDATRQLADKLVDVEAYLGRIQGSANGVYRKVARELTEILNAPREQPMAQWERDLAGHAPDCERARFDGSCCRPERPEPLPDPVVLSA